MSVLVSSRVIYTEIIINVVLNFKKRIQNLSLAGELTGRGSINPLMSLESKHFEYIYPLLNFLLEC